MCIRDSLDSIPKEDRKNETEEQTLKRVGKYLEELGLSLIHI